MGAASKGPNDAPSELLERVVDQAAKLLIAKLPLLQKISMTVIETVFVPRTILRQIVLLIALETGLVTLNQITSLIQYVLGNFWWSQPSQRRLIRRLLVQQQEAETQDEWMDLAARIDRIQGNDAWRSDPNCALYERDRIAARIDEFVHLMKRHDSFELMFVLRGSIARNKFGLLHEGLFSKAMAGTKVLVETYHSVVCAALDYVCDAPVLPDADPIPTDARLAFFNETRHSFGRTALLLSGGAALGHYHVGTCKALLENSLMPRVLGGSSAGSILCAMIGTRTDDELHNELFKAQGTDAPGHSGRLRLDFFRPIVLQEQTAPESTDATKEDASATSVGFGFRRVYRNTAGAFHDAKRTVQGFVPITLRRATSFLYDVLTGNRRAQDVFKNDTYHFRECVRANVGNFTFQEAFDRTGRILNIVVTPNNSSDPPRLLNYLTAPHVLVWSAAVASSSLPGVFEANRLVVKEADGWERYESGGSQHFSDGSMEQDLPMEQLSEMFNINHFIISQANPHAVMFASYSQNNSGVWSNPITGILHSVVRFLKDQVRSFLVHLVQLVGARRIAPLFETQRGIGTQFFTQEYEGRSCDISLIPWIRHRSLFSALLHIIYNPNTEEWLEWIKAAERETWRHIPAIKSHIAEEVTLDRCVQRLRKRLVRESWEKTNHGNNKMGNRVPSFFTSPSLVNLGGLNVSDQTDLESFRGRGKNPANGHGGDQVPAPPAPPKVIPQVDINSGWRGLGLKGNCSGGDLKRSSSAISGLFIDDDEHHHKAAAALAVQNDPSVTRSPMTTAATIQQEQQQEAGERTNHGTERKQPRAGAPSNNVTEIPQMRGYVKTTSMARFYYRKMVRSNSYDDEAFRKISSDPMLDNSATANGSGGGGNHVAGHCNLPKPAHERRRSRSHADLVSSLPTSRELEFLVSSKE